jgi:hypothetical protein
MLKSCSLLVLRHSKALLIFNSWLQLVLLVPGFVLVSIVCS